MGLYYDDKIFDRMTAWWEGDMIDRACVSFTLKKADEPSLKFDLNSIWNNPDIWPDLDRTVRCHVDRAKATAYYGEAVPTIPHHYGDRGTPETMAFYLGGKVGYTEDSVWVDPTITDFDNCSLDFDPENRWWRLSKDLFDAQLRAGIQEDIIPCLPDFGDSFTALSLLRGVEPLLFDLIDRKEAVIAARDRFIRLWRSYHYELWREFNKSFSGDLSWLIWAPGKSFACQCDFSTMISPSMFEELVVPEIEAMSDYLDYIVWHLDGPEEIRHLDILLEQPGIKAIQWVPGDGKPTAAHWLPMLKKIQRAGRSLYVYASDEKEVETLLRELSPKGLFIDGGFTGDSHEEAKDFMKMVTDLSSDG